MRTSSAAVVQARESTVANPLGAELGEPRLLGKPANDTELPQPGSRIKPKPRRVCPMPCPALTTTSGAKASDAPLSMEHVPCVLLQFGPLIAKLIQKGVASLRVRRLVERLQKNGVRVESCGAAVSRMLRADRSCIEDLEQEVALAIVDAVDRGKLHSARPAIFGWLMTTVPNVVNQYCRLPAIQGLTGALSLDGASNSLEVDEPRDSAGIERYEDSAPSPEVLLQKVRAMRAVERLTSKQADVVRLILEGKDTDDIALELGLTPGAVRLRLMAAKRRMRGARERSTRNTYAPSGMGHAGCSDETHLAGSGHGRVEPTNYAEEPELIDGGPGWETAACPPRVA